jgi:PhnB protein
MSVKPIPEGYHAVTPHLVVRGCARAIDFYKKAFGAVECYRMQGPDGKVGHADLLIGDSHVMLADEYPDMGYVGPEAAKGTPVTLHLYVNDVDSRFAQAIAAGATSVRPLQDQFYGDRNGVVRDPFGHVWSISTHKEDLSEEEIRRRHEELAKAHPGS